MKSLNVHNLIIQRKLFQKKLALFTQHVMINELLYIYVYRLDSFTFIIIYVTISKINKYTF